MPRTQPKYRAGVVWIFVVVQKVFLEVFAGCARLSAAFTENMKAIAVPIDINNGAWADIEKDQVQEVSVELGFGDGCHCIYAPSTKNLMRNCRSAVFCAYGKEGRCQISLFHSLDVLSQFTRKDPPPRRLGQALFCIA